MALVVIAAAVTVLLVTRASGPQPPAVGSERMVPAAVLAYLHVSTDPEREVDAQADTLLSRLPGLQSAFDNLVAGVVSIGPGLSYRRDVRPWLGEQVAVALLDTPNTTATPLAVLAVADRTGADAFLARAGTPPQVSDHRGARIATYGTLSTAFAGRFLLVGPLSAVRAGLDVSAGRSPALGRDPLFARTTRGLPSDRVADAYLPADGVRRLLAAQPGVLGAAGALIVRGDLRASALSMSATQDGARLRVRSVLDPAAGTAPVAAFEPRLTEAVPGSAMAYLGTTRLDRSVGRVLAAVAGGAAPALGALAQRTGASARRSGIDLGRELRALAPGEVALWLRSASPEPVLTMIAASPDEAATRRTLARVRGPLLGALRPRGPSPGPAPTVADREVAGVRASVVTLGPAAQIAYAVFDGRLVVSTSLEGIRATREASDPVAGTRALEEVLDRGPAAVTSIVFLDLSQVLALGERSGLSNSFAYRAIRRDLSRLRSLGAATSGGRRESTTDLFLQIP